MTQSTFKVETSGGGSVFEAQVREYKADAGKFDPHHVVAKKNGFRSRVDAARWGREKVRELLGIPPKAPPAQNCKTCRWREGGTRWEAGVCTFPLPEFPVLPWSITNTGFDPARLNRVGVWPTDGDGEGCPTWAERPKVQPGPKVRR